MDCEGCGKELEKGEEVFKVVDRNKRLRMVCSVCEMRYDMSHENIFDD